MRTRRWRPSAGSLPRRSTRSPASALPGTTATPRQDPCGAPGKALTKDASRATARLAPAKSPPPLACSCQLNQPHWTRAREAPLWWHADLSQDHRDMRSDENQKTATLGGILAEEIHKPPGKRLAGDDCNAMARPLPGPRQDPCRGHHRGHCQARTSQESTAVRKQLLAQPAGQAPAWRRAASTPTQQAPAWWHADLREDPTTAPPQLPACLHGAACTAGLGAC